MAENESFLRKVVRFVANPATDWHDLNSRQEDSRELELEKSELKAMIERKRRNDFVRKREFDMLRRVRREGLSPEQIAALGNSSKLDDSEAKLPDISAPNSVGVKDKIDAIEKQMVGDASFVPSTRRASGFQATPTAPDLQLRPLPSARAASAGRGAVPGGDELPALPPLPPLKGEGLPPASAPAPVQLGGGLPPLAPMTAVSFNPTSAVPPARRQAPAATLASAAASDKPAAANAPSPARPVPPAETGDGQGGFAVEVSEVVHDPELDEAVIAFANADFGVCEAALRRITTAGGSRMQHAETWLVLFDLYRATGQQQPFESLAVDYAQQFGWSAPQWYSLPKLVADALADEPLVAREPASSTLAGEIGWICPDLLDIDSVARLRSLTLQMPLPWVFDWSQLRGIEAEAAMQLSTLFRLWAGQALEMRWMAGDRLFAVLQEAAPTGVKDADPAFWLTRLDALRLANRADQFDEAAIDYCVTYEVSPPSWEAARCKVHIRGSGLSTRTPTMSMVSEVSTSFLESALNDGGDGVEVAHVELSGQLVGDIGSTLAKLKAELGSAPVVSVSCARLIRVDFIAAGDLLNWVLARRNESRDVLFVDTHRLVALFFGAMGINEHARVQVRKV